MHASGTEHPLLLRTDFSDDDAWRVICEAAAATYLHGFRANVHPVNDRAFDGAAVSDVIDTGAGSPHGFLFIVDRDTLAHPERPILVVHLRDSRRFRVVPSELWSIENNLSLANLDFDDFVTHVDADGIFRAFPD